MATLTSVDRQNKLTLGVAQAGNVDTSNLLDRLNYRGPGLLKIDSVAGTTVKLDIMGSMSADAAVTDWFNVGYALVATPTTVVVAQITITTTTTNYYILATDQPWRFLKGIYSANTGMTMSAYIWS
jgi:hypothetical protein